MNEIEDDGGHVCVEPILALSCGTDQKFRALVKKTAFALVARWKDYAPTEAAIKGDDCLRNGDTDGQHF